MPYNHPDRLRRLGHAGRRILPAVTHGLLCLANVPPSGPCRDPGRVDWPRSRDTDWDAELRILTSARPPL